MRYLLLLLFISSCTTIRVGDTFGYRISYKGPDDPLDKNSKGNYTIQARVLAKSNGYVRYKAQIFKDDSAILVESARDFKKDFKKLN